MALELLLLRHAATPGNLLSRYIGVTDEDLSEAGRQSAALLCGLYPDLQAVYSSPLRRCLQTAALAFPGRRAHIIEKLRETDFGDFENRSYEDLKDEPAYIAWLESGGALPFPNGESRVSATARVLEGFSALISDALERGLTKAALVTHGGVIMSIMSELVSPKRDYYDWQIKNCQGYVVLAGQSGSLDVISKFPAQ